MKDSNKVCAIDANVILRYLLRDNEEQWVKAHAVIAQVEDGALVVVCDPVILAEVVWVLTSVYKLTHQHAASIVIPLVKADGFSVPNKDRYIRALELYATTVPHFGDACACAAALEQCGGKLLSFDKKLSGISGIQRQEETVA